MWHPIWDTLSKPQKKELKGTALAKPRRCIYQSNPLLQLPIRFPKNADNSEDGNLSTKQGIREKQ